MCVVGHCKRDCSFQTLKVHAIQEALLDDII